MKIMSSATISNNTLIISIALFALFSGPVSAWETDDEPDQKKAEISDAIAAPVTSDYRVNPGDIINVSVWRENELRADVLVRPDGKFFGPP